jgi:uncharacterized protein
MRVPPTVRQIRRVFCALSLAMPTAAAAQVTTPADSANVVLARRLLQTMHYDDNMVAVVGAAVSRQRQNAQLAPVFYDSLLARMKRSAPDLLDSIAPVYARRFTGTELEAMIRFYQSPIGQIWAQQQGALGAETMMLGQRWGARMGAAVVKDLVDAGVDVTAH